MRFIDKAVIEIATITGGTAHAAGVIRGVLECAVDRGKLPAVGPDRNFVIYVAESIEDRMAFDGFPIRSFLRPDYVEFWPRDVGYLLTE